MLTDGERLKRLINSARTEIILCAPFIKRDVLSNLLEMAPPRVRVTVITRWKAAEVAAGVSDLSVYELMAERENAQLLLLDELHAKLYVGDSSCLVGSANLTAKALGWSSNPNIEILVDLDRSDGHVQDLLNSFNDAYQATYALRAKIQEEANALKEITLEEGEAADSDNPAAKPHFWLPQCGAPERLYSVYQKLGSGSPIFSSSENDAQADIESLGIPKDLDEAAFKRNVANVIATLPGMTAILEGIPGTLNDEDGEALVGQIYPNYEAQDRKKQWEIVREWISVFLADRYEVAPSNFVVRLKPKRS